MLAKDGGGNFPENRQPNPQDARASPADLPRRNLSFGNPIPGVSAPGVSPESRTRGIFFRAPRYRPPCPATPATARGPLPGPGAPVRKTVSAARHRARSQPAGSCWWTSDWATTGTRPIRPEGRCWRRTVAGTFPRIASLIPKTRERLPPTSLGGIYLSVTPYRESLPRVCPLNHAPGVSFSGPRATVRLVQPHQQLPAGRFQALARR